MKKNAPTASDPLHPHACAGVTRPFRRRILAGAIAAFLGCAGGAEAATQFWDVNGVLPGLGGTGAWDLTTPNWNNLTGIGVPQVWTNTATSDASFRDTPGVVTLTVAGVVARNLTFTVGGYTIAGSLAAPLNLQPGSLLTVTNAADTATISAPIVTTTGFDKQGGGTVLLSGQNTYTGQTSVSAGTLEAGATTAFSAMSGFVVNGTLDLGGFSNAIGSLAGLTGGFVQNSGATPATLTTGGNNVDAIFQGLIRDGDGAAGGSALGLVKTGTGRQTLTSANTYSLGTVLENGSLFADNNSALGTGRLTITSAGGPTTLGNSVANTTLTIPISVQSDFSVFSAGDLRLNGAVDLNAATRVITGTNNQAQIHFGGIISNGAVTFTTAGLPAPVAGANSYVAFIYDGPSEHAYTGLTTVDANAFLVLQNPGEKIRGDVLVQGSGVVDYLNSFFLPANDQIADTATVTVNSPGSAIPGQFSNSVFAGLELRGNRDTIGALFGSSVGTVGLGSGILTVGAGNFRGVIGDGDFGVGGQLTKNTPGTLTLGGANTYTGNTNINNGTLVLDGSVQSPNVFVNFAGTLMGTGTAFHNVRNAGVFSPGNSTGTFRIGGEFSQSGAGTTVIEIRSARPGEHDLVSVGGRAFLEGTLRLVKLGNARLKVGDRIPFLTAQGGVTGRFLNVTNPFATGTIASAAVVYRPNEVALEVQQGSFAALGMMVKLTPNQKIVATELDDVVSASSQKKLIAFLDGEPLANLPRDFDLIAAEELQSIYSIGLSQANVQTANLQRRMDDIRSGRTGFSAEGLSVSGTGEQEHAAALPAAPPPAGANGPAGQGGKELRAPADPRFGAFITGVGEFSRVGVTTNAQGYRLATGGFTLGVDYRLTPQITVGLNTGYARSGADLTGGGRVTVDGAKLGVYATYFDEGFYVDAAVQGGYNSYDTRRTALQGRATGSTTGGEVNALIATGFDFTSDALRIGPTASFQYTHLGFSGFRESGSLAPLQFGGQASDSTRTAIGLKAAYEFRLASGVVVRPEARAAWQHEFGDIAYAIDSRFANGGGNSFTIHGAETGRDGALVGLGVAVLWNDSTAAYLYYDGEVGRANYSSNNVSGGVRMAF